jgi:hypothetical protein
MENNTKFIPQGILCQGIDWIQLACDTDKCLATVDTVMNLTVSGWKFLDYPIGYQLLMRILFRVIAYPTFKLAEVFVINS